MFGSQKTKEIESDDASSHSKVRRSITESPWYWVYLFCTAGLVALLLAGPKFAARQSQIERKAQGRQRAVQNVSGREPITQLSDEEHTQISLRPLYYVLSGFLLVAWLHLIWRQYYYKHLFNPEPTPTAHGGKDP